MNKIIVIILGFILGIVTVLVGTNIYFKIKIANQVPIIIEAESKIPYDYLGKFTISFYNLNKNRTAQGTEVRDGHTVACDTNVIPANSYIYIEDFGVRQCVDTGLHIKQHRLDIYVNKDTKELLRMGIQKKKVYLIKEYKNE